MRLLSPVSRGSWLSEAARGPVGRMSEESVERSGGLAQKATRSVGWVVLDKWGNRLTSLLVFAILGRLVAPSDFGLIALAAVYITILSVFVDSGFGSAVVQRNDLTDEHTSTAFWISLFTGIV